MRKDCINEVGNIYGQLKVLDRVEGNGKTKWKCRCSCGEEIICTGSDLRTKRRTSCGKRCNSIKSELGKKYGFLKVLSKDPTPAKEFADHSIHWICKCEICDSVKSISGKNLRTGRTISCGCIRSTGEQIIAQFLNQNNIPFKKEVTFKDLKDKDYLRFDFGVYDNNKKLLGLIEFQGYQHFKKDIKFFNNFSYNDIRKRDLMKEEYCYNNNINLLLLYQGDVHVYKQKELIESEIMNFINYIKGENKYVKTSYSYLGDLSF